EVLPVGADRPREIDVTIVAATNRSLAEMVEAGQFRSDLYARLAMARVTLPPLRDRPEDLFPVAQALARRGGYELSAGEVEVEAIERLALARFARNVRELAGALEAARRVDPDPGLGLWALKDAR